MTDHEADIATLHQEATQLRARIKRYEAALREIARPKTGPGEDWDALEVQEWRARYYRIYSKIAREALQESSQ